MNMKTFFTTIVTSLVIIAAVFQIGSSIVVNNKMDEVVTISNNTNQKAIEAIQLLDLRIQENTDNINDLTEALVNMKKEIK